MTPAPPADRRCDILVVGGGPGGAAAAVRGARAGAHVIMLDEAARPSRLAMLGGVEVLAGVVPWGAFAPDEIAAVVDGVSVVFRPRRLVLAPRQTAIPLAIPGWALPGVGTLQQPVGPGRLVLAGGPGILRAACHAVGAGRSVVAVALTQEPSTLRDELRLRRLRDADVPVLHHTTPVRCEGGERFRALMLETRTGPLRIEAEACVLHGGYAPETGLARALGARHAVIAPGVLATVIGPSGRTNVPGVVALGDGLTVPGPAGRRRYEAAPYGPATRPPSVDTRFADADFACACERVTAGAIRAAIRDGAASVPAVKRATRAGMGRCQARLCNQTLHGLCAPAAAESRFIAPRAPLHPVRIGGLMQPGDPHPEPEGRPGYSTWSSIPAGAAPRACDALVIGGGVVGLSAALALARAGIDVALVDRGEPGLGASTANAGSLHVQLLPYDFDEGDPGPLGEALALGPRSIALWRGLAADAGEALGIRTEGGLVLAANPADLVWLARKAEFERSRGIETEILSAAELRGLAPALAAGYAGAAFCGREGQIDPLRGTMALLRLAREAGVRIAAGVEVSGMAQCGPVWRVRTTGGDIQAGQVLNAAGAHAAMVGGLAGVSLPVRAVVQQVIATAPAPPLLRHLVAQARLHLSLKQGDAGHVLIGGGWPGRLGADGATRLDRRSIQGNLWTAAQVVPALAELEAVRAWTGLTVHLDRGPVISATPGRAGLFHAVTANGYTLGPIAGELIAEAMLGRGAPPAAFALV